jgi:hypothetical protein
LTADFQGLSYHRFTVYKDADLFDFINAPVGKGLPIAEKLRPLIAGMLFVFNTLTIND